MEMKKRVLFLVLILIAVTGCTSNQGEKKTGASSSTEVLTESSEKKKFFYETVSWKSGVNQNEEIQGDENNSFLIRGMIEEGESIFLVDNATGEVLAKSSVDEDKYFEIQCKMKDTERKVLLFTTDSEANTAAISRPKNLINSMPLTFIPNEDFVKKAEEEKKKQAEADEKKRQVEEKQRKEAEEKRRQEEEKKRKEAEEKRHQEEEKQRKEAEEKKKQEEEAAAKKKAEEEAAAAVAYDTGITYENLARNPDSFLLKKVKFSGRIIQVIKGSKSSKYRFKVNDDYNQVILIEIDNAQLENNRILEDDYLTIKGVSYGEYTYSSTMGGEITVPAVIVDSFEFN